MNVAMRNTIKERQRQKWGGGVGEGGRKARKEKVRLPHLVSKAKFQLKT